MNGQCKPNSRYFVLLL